MPSFASARPWLCVCAREWERGLFVLLIHVHTYTHEQVLIHLTMREVGAILEALDRAATLAASLNMTRYGLNMTRCGPNMASY